MNLGLSLSRSVINAEEQSFEFAAADEASSAEVPWEGGHGKESWGNNEGQRGVLGSRIWRWVEANFF